MTSMKTTREEDAYNCVYPSVLPWERLVNVLEKGALLEKNGTIHEIEQIIRPLIPGSKIRIVLKKHGTESAGNLQRTASPDN